MEYPKNIDESWKESIAQEKEAKGKSPLLDGNGKGELSDEQTKTQQDFPEVNFATYISSLVFQAVIFLGEVPNPLTNKVEKDLRQAKFIIDTVTLIKEKTKGNLSPEEENMLSAALYELQMKYIEITQKGDVL